MSLQLFMLSSEFYSFGPELSNFLHRYLSFLGLDWCNGQ